LGGSAIAMIKITGLTKVFGDGANAFTALDDVDVTIEQNEFFTLLGPSGCGKTTLLRSIAGFVEPSAGSITLDGTDLASQPPHTRPVNTVFQNYALFPHMSVAENIGFGLRMQGVNKGKIRETVAEMLELVQMTAMAERKVAQISGGQQQRVALARALAPKPKVLLLDEPLSALDFKLRKEMQIELKRLQSETGITFVFVTHDQEEALSMSDRIAVMCEGRILQIGTPREIYAHPAQRFVADFIGDTNFVGGRVISLDAGFAMLQLDDGGIVRARNTIDAKVDSKAVLVVRPEHAVLTPEKGDLTGILSNIIFFGTDTHFHVTLPDASEFSVRQQNQADHVVHWKKGDKVGISFNAETSQMLAN